MKSKLTVCPYKYEDYLRYPYESEKSQFKKNGKNYRFSKLKNNGQVLLTRE